jgi:flagellar biosynthesis/type III secretory pathway protein FliH
MNWWRIRQDNYNADCRAKRIAREEGLAEGRAKGLAEGLEEGFRLMAGQLREMGLSEEVIKGAIEKAKCGGGTRVTPEK